MLVYCIGVFLSGFTLYRVFVSAVWSFFPLKSVDFYPFLFHLHLQPNVCTPCGRRGYPFFKIYFYLFIWLCWVLVVACRI